MAIHSAQRPGNPTSRLFPLMLTFLLAVGAQTACGQSYTFSTFARLGSSPGGVATDRAGNIYVADSVSHTIRKITPTGGVVSIIAGSVGNPGTVDGTGSVARFRSPVGIAVDSTDNLLVADSFNHTIRRITPAGVVTTLAGMAGSTGTADGSGNAARFNLPCGMAVDAVNNLFVADAYNHTIRRVTPAGVVTTFAGAAGVSGNANGVGGNARFWIPRGVAMDGAGNMFVADMQNQTIRKITPAGVVTTLAGGYIEALWKWVKHSYTGEDAFRDACLSSLVARKATSIFYVLENSSEGFNLWLGGNVVLGMYILGTPSPVDGHRTDDFVKRCNSLGITTQVPVLFNSPDSFAGSFSQHDGYIQWLAQSIAWAPANQFIVCISHHTHLNAQISASWTADYVNQLAGKVKQATGGRFKVAVHDNYPQCIAWGRGSNVDIIYVDRENRSDADLATVLADVRNQTGKTVEACVTNPTDGVGTGAQFTTPSSVATDGAGNVFVTDNNTVRRVTPGGVVTTLAGTPGVAGNVDGTGSAVRFNAVGGIAVDRGDNIFAADGSNNAIRKGLFEIRMAVNAPALTFTTGGDINWIGQMVVSHDGSDAARSGPIGDGQQSWMQTTVTGPGSLLYWWKLSSEAGGDVLSFVVDGVTQEQISGEVNWKLRAKFLGAGTHTLRWTYLKNGARTAGADAGWVDQVQWLSCPAAPGAPQMFFQNNEGLLVSWVLNSAGSLQFTRVLGTLEGWELKTTGDVDRDGTADLFFQNTSGDVALWFMNADGSTRSTAYLGNVGAWMVRACAEYDGDGYAEIFFQTPAGNTAYWHLATNGASLGAQSLGNLGGWRLKTATEMDGNGKGELLWQTAEGLVAAWFRNTDGTIRGQILGTTGVWELRGAVDMDGDGTGDLLWQTPDSTPAIWFMRTNGTARACSVWASTAGWKLKAAGK
ncbi:MAG: FG-GAP-like repeat-containing protein [Kiritimatiellaeota bacterium]|nr:FG-GAP-like repeat-containing protein [Kiritimatiellota bacterium]